MMGEEDDMISVWSKAFALFRKDDTSCCSSGSLTYFIDEEIALGIYALIQQRSLSVILNVKLP